MFFTNLGVEKRVIMKKRKKNLKHDHGSHWHCLTQPEVSTPSRYSHMKDDGNFIQVIRRVIGSVYQIFSPLFISGHKVGFQCLAPLWLGGTKWYVLAGQL